MKRSFYYFSIKIDLISASLIMMKKLYNEYLDRSWYCHPG